jgi:muramoyltetrapeptide carboxypeptidase LdcA involved in peptidoglycan recycling
VSGIAIGLNADCDDPHRWQPRLALQDAVAAKEYRQRRRWKEVQFAPRCPERLLPLKIPVITGLPFGHVPMNATLPFGVRAELDANRGTLRLLEAGVS